MNRARMNRKILFRKIRNDERVLSVSETSEGWVWIDLKSGWYNPWMECAIIHTEDVESAFSELEDVVRKCNDGGDGDG